MAITQRHREGTCQATGQPDKSTLQDTATSQAMNITTTEPGQAIKWTYGQPINQNGYQYIQVKDSKGRVIGTMQHHV